jgi:ADP-ribose pyrophosphatase YjhB (NUDIX family)
VNDRTDTQTGWLTPADLELVRGRVPIVYVDAVPVRVDSHGQVTNVGLLLRAMPDGTISRAVVSGRVLFGERVRDALVRHLERDLGPVALPRVPPAPQPFTVAEYFPDPTVTGFTDPRQHAVSLAYVVPCDGDCTPRQDSLDLAWVTPEEAVSREVRREMTSGHDRLVVLAMAHVGRIV